MKNIFSVTGIIFLLFATIAIIGMPNPSLASNWVIPSSTTAAPPSSGLTIPELTVVPQPESPNLIVTNPSSNGAWVYNDFPAKFSYMSPDLDLNNCQYKVESLVNGAWIITKPWTPAGSCSGGSATLSKIITVGSGKDCRREGVNTCRIKLRTQNIQALWIESGYKTLSIDWTFVIWALADIQPADEGNWLKFDSVINDIKANIPFDLAFVAGDIVNAGEKAADFDTYLSKISTLPTPRTNFFHVAGNHDYQQPAGTLDNYKLKIGPDLRYAIQKGNILAIFMSDESNSISGEISDATFNWWKNLVISNQNKIIITVTHQPLYDTTVGSTAPGLYIIGSNRFISILQSYRVDLWIHGHVPINLNQNNTVVQKWGTLHLNTAMHTSSPGLDPFSRVLTFIGGSNTVNIKLRNHRNQSFFSSYEYNYQFRHPFYR